MINKAIVVANGIVDDGPALQQTLSEVTPDTAIICADGGADVALSLNLQPSLVVGDLDSIQPKTLNQLERQGITISRHSPDKDETDLELALLEAVQRGATWMRVIGAGGGRLDQTLANIYLLALPQLKTTDVRLVSGKQTTWLLAPGQHSLIGQVGDTISLIAFNNDVQGITTAHLKYPLNNESLHFGPARGISNLITDSDPRVSFTSGQLLVIHTIGKA